MPRSIRYFCPVGQHGDWADLGYTYFLALAATDAKIRVLSTAMVNLSYKTRWDDHSRVFVEPVEAGYLNVVCGDNGELQRLYTVGTENIAITMTKDRPPGVEETVSLKKYDCVLCPTPEDVEVLKEAGVEAECVPPEAATDRIRKFL